MRNLFSIFSDWKNILVSFQFFFMFCLIFDYSVWGQTTVSIGSGTTTSTSGTSGTPSRLSPFSTYWKDGRHAYLYLASEIIAGGGISGTISSIAFNVESNYSLQMNNFTVKMKLLPATTTTIANFESTSLSNCYSGSYSVTSSGWNTITLQSGLSWDGVSNVYIEICYDNSTLTSTSSVYGTNLGSGVNRTVFSVSDISSGCTLTAAGSDRVRPNIKMVITSNCTTPTISLVTPTNPLTCGGSDGQITVTTLGTVTDYSKDNGSTWEASSSNLFTFSSLTAGSYNIKVRNTASCVATYASNSVTLSNPTAPASPSNISQGSSTCVGTGVTFTQGACTSGSTCYWVSSATGTETTNSSSNYTSPTSAGTYNVWVRAKNNLTQCWSSAVTASGTVSAGPAPTNVDAGANVAICNGNSTSLSGSATGASGSTAPISTEMTNSVYDTDNTEVSVTLSGAPTGSVITSITLKPLVWIEDVLEMGCLLFGDCYAYKCHAYNDYSKMQYWNGSTWINIADCDNTLTINSFNGNSVNGQTIKIRTVDMDGISDVVYTDLLDVTANYTIPVIFSWSASTGGFSSSQQSPGSVSPTATTTYTLTATSNGCIATDNVVVTVNTPSIPYSIENKEYYIWRGATSSSLTTASNWYYHGTNNIWSVSNTTPSAGKYVIIGSGECVSTNPTITSSISNFADSLILLSGSNLTILGSDVRLSVNNDLVVKSGGTLTMGSGTPTLEIKGGSLKFQGNSTFIPGTGTVEMHYRTGHADAHTISCSSNSNSVFYNLNFHGDNMEFNDSPVSLASNITVNGTLEVVTANFNLAGYTVTLGSNGSIIEGANGKKIYDIGNGKIVTTRDLGLGATSNFGGLGLTVTLPNNKSLGSTTVERYHTSSLLSVDPLSGLTGIANQPIERFYRVTPTNNGTKENPLNATVVFNYKTADLGFYVSEDESTFALYRKAIGDAEWEQLNGILDVANKTLTVPNFPRFSDLTIGNGGTPLPVELVSFSGTCNEKEVIIQWQTASEHNSSHFDIEKSVDGENWRTLKTLLSAGNSNQILNYSLIDENASEGNNYYRLKQFDVDGKSKLYGPLAIGCQATDKIYFATYPNPSGTNFNVLVNNLPFEGLSEIKIIDSRGILVSSKKVEVKQGINMFGISQDFDSGIYFISISNGDRATEVVKHLVK